MRIGLIIYGSLDTVSGGYLYDRMLVRALRQTGHEVEVLSLPWRNYPAHLGDNLRLPWAKTIARRGFDLLLQDELNHPSLFLLARYWRRVLGCPQVAIVHHLRSSEDHPPLHMPIYRLVERAYLRGVDGFIFNSQTTARAVTALAHPAKPYHIAYPAADHIQPPPREAIEARLRARAAQGGPLRLVFVGNVIPRKGLHHLLAGLSGLDPTTWTLDIIGDYTLEPAYTAAMHVATAERGLTTRVTWHGRVDDATLRRRLAAADLLAVPSYEGFGIVYLEAMAYGLPVLAAVTGAASEIVRHGVNGFLVEPENASAIAACLAAVAENSEMLAKMSRVARDCYDSYPVWGVTMVGCNLWLRETYLV